MFKTQNPKFRIALIAIFVLFFASGSVSLALQSPTQAYALQNPTSTPVLKEATQIPGENLNIDGIDGNKLVNDLNNNGLPDPGDTVQYTIRYSNSGNTDLTNIVLVNEYDKDAVAKIASVSPGGVHDAEKGVITWEIGTLARTVKSSVTFEATFNSKFDPNGSLKVLDTATISSLKAGAAPVSVSLAHFLELRIPQLRISKEMSLITDINRNGSPDPEDTISYTITLRNLGTVEAESISIEDDYDQAKLGQPTAISNNGQSDGNSITWSHSLLEPGGEITNTYNVTLSSTLPEGNSSIMNKVTASSRVTNPIAAENTFAIEVSASPTPTVVQPILPTATPEPSFKPAGPTTSGSVSGTGQALLAAGFMILALGGLLAIGYLSFHKIPIPTTLRDGFILSLVMGTVIILGLAGSVERSAIAGLIGTVAGYVLRSVSEGKGKQ